MAKRKFNRPYNYEPSMCPEDYTNGCVVHDQYGIGQPWYIEQYLPTFEEALVRYRWLKECFPDRIFGLCGYDWYKKKMESIRKK